MKSRIRFKQVGSYGKILLENTLWISIACLNFSTALSSIFFGLFALYLLFGKMSRSQINSKNYSWFGWVGLLVFITIMVVSAGTGSSFNSILSYAQIKLPLLVMLLAIGLKRRFPQRNSSSWWFYLLPHCWIVAASCIHYWQHWQFYSLMVLESKPIPMYTQVYHIEYGALVALSVLMFVDDFFSKRIESRDTGWAMFVVGITVVGLHVLALRTGLILLYLGFLIVIWNYAKSQNLGRDRVLKLLSIMLVVFIAAISILPSIRHRIINTVDDFSIIFKGGDTNHRSMGQRVEAWTAAISVIKSNPLGVGVDGEFNAMMKGYDDSQSQLAIQHRIGIHNQWLQIAVQGGWLAVILALSWLLGGVLRLPSGKWLILLIAGFMVESLLERQSGILISVLTLLPSMQDSKENSLEEEKNR